MQSKDDSIVNDIETILPSSPSSSSSSDPRSVLMPTSISIVPVTNSSSSTSSSSASQTIKLLAPNLIDPSMVEPSHSLSSSSNCTKTTSVSQLLSFSTGCDKNCGGIGVGRISSTMDKMATLSSSAAAAAKTSQHDDHYHPSDTNDRLNCDVDKINSLKNQLDSVGKSTGTVGSNTMTNVKSSSPPGTIKSFQKQSNLMQNNVPSSTTPSSSSSLSPPSTSIKYSKNLFQQDDFDDSIAKLSTSSNTLATVIIDHHPHHLHNHHPQHSRDHQSSPSMTMMKSITIDKDRRESKLFEANENPSIEDTDEFRIRRTAASIESSCGLIKDYDHRNHQSPPAISSAALNNQSFSISIDQSYRTNVIEDKLNRNNSIPFDRACNEIGIMNGITSTTDINHQSFSSPSSTSMAKIISNSQPFDRNNSDEIYTKEINMNDRHLHQRANTIYEIPSLLKDRFSKGSSISSSFHRNHSTNSQRSFSSSMRKIPSDSYRNFLDENIPSLSSPSVTSNKTANDNKSISSSSPYQYLQVPSSSSASNNSIFKGSNTLASSCPPPQSSSSKSSTSTSSSAFVAPQRSEYESLIKRYAELDSFHVVVVNKLSMTEAENRQHRKRNEEILQQLNRSMNSRQILQEELNNYGFKHEKLLREMNELQDQLVKVKKQRDEANKECQNAMNGRNKANRERQQMYEERNTAIREYNLIMSERDSVHKEIEKLHEDLQDVQKRNDSLEKENRLTSSELESLRRELASALLDRDRALELCNDLRDRQSNCNVHNDFITSTHQTASFPSASSINHNNSQNSVNCLQPNQSDGLSKNIGSQDIVNCNSSSDGSLIGGGQSNLNFPLQSPSQLSISNNSGVINGTKHKMANSSSTSSISTFSASQTVTSSLPNRIQMSMEQSKSVPNSSSNNSLTLATPLVNNMTGSTAPINTSGTVSNNNSVSTTNEVEYLREQVQSLRTELQKVNQEIETWKIRRDWAINERDRIVLERESVRALCDKLRKERDRKNSDLADALRESFEIKRQKSEALKELESLRSKLDSVLKANTVNENNENLFEFIETNDHRSNSIEKQELKSNTMKSPIETANTVTTEVVDTNTGEEKRTATGTGITCASQDSAIDVDDGNAAGQIITTSLPLLSLNSTINFDDSDQSDAMNRMFGLNGDLFFILNRQLSPILMMNNSNNTNNIETSSNIEIGQTNNSDVSASNQNPLNGTFNVGERIISINGISLNQILLKHLLKFMLERLDPKTRTLKIKSFRLTNESFSPMSDTFQSKPSTSMISSKTMTVSKIDGCQQTTTSQILMNKFSESSQSKPSIITDTAIILADSIESDLDDDELPRLIKDEDNDADEDEPNSDQDESNQSEIKTLAQLDRVLDEYQLDTVNGDLESEFDCHHLEQENERRQRTYLIQEQSNDIVENLEMKNVNDGSNKVAEIEIDEALESIRSNPTTILSSVHRSRSNRSTGSGKRSKFYHRIYNDLTTSSSNNVEKRDDTHRDNNHFDRENNEDDDGSIEMKKSKPKRSPLKTLSMNSGDTWPRYRPHQLLSSILPLFYKNHGQELQKIYAKQQDQQQLQKQSSKLKHSTTGKSSTSSKNLFKNLANLGYVTTSFNKRKQRKSLGLFMDLFPKNDRSTTTIASTISSDRDESIDFSSKENNNISNDNKIDDRSQSKCEDGSDNPRKSSKIALNRSEFLIGLNELDANSSLRTDNVSINKIGIDDSSHNQSSYTDRVNRSTLMVDRDFMGVSKQKKTIPIIHNSTHQHQLIDHRQSFSIHSKFDPNVLSQKNYDSYEYKRVDHLNKRKDLSRLQDFNSMMIPIRYDPYSFGDGNSNRTVNENSIEVYSPIGATLMDRKDTKNQNSYRIQSSQAECSSSMPIPTSSTVYVRTSATGSIEKHPTIIAQHSRLIDDESYENGTSSIPSQYENRLQQHLHQYQYYHPQQQQQPQSLPIISTTAPPIIMDYSVVSRHNNNANVLNYSDKLKSSLNEKSGSNLNDQPQVVDHRSYDLYGRTMPRKQSQGSSEIYAGNDRIGPRPISFDGSSPSSSNIATKATASNYSIGLPHSSYVSGTKFSDHLHHSSSLSSPRKRYQSSRYSLNLGQSMGSSSSSSSISSPMMLTQSTMTMKSATMANTIATTSTATTSVVLPTRDFLNLTDLNRFKSINVDHYGIIQQSQQHPHQFLHFINNTDPSSYHQHHHHHHTQLNSIDLPTNPMYRSLYNPKESYTYSQQSSRASASSTTSFLTGPSNLEQSNPADDFNRHYSQQNSDLDHLNHHQHHHNEYHQDRNHHHYEQNLYSHHNQQQQHNHHHQYSLPGTIYASSSLNGRKLLSASPLLLPPPPPIPKQQQQTSHNHHFLQDVNQSNHRHHSSMNQAGTDDEQTSSSLVNPIQRIRIPSSSNSVSSTKSIPKSLWLPNTPIISPNLGLLSVGDRNSFAFQNNGGSQIEVKWIRCTKDGSPGSPILDPRKAKSDDYRLITIDRSSSSLGIRILRTSNEHQKGVFVEAVNEGSLAAQAGIKIGDQIIDIWGLNMRMANFEIAAKVLNQCRDPIQMLVQKNFEKFKEIQSKQLIETIDLQQSLSGSDYSIQNATMKTMNNFESTLSNSRMPIIGREADI